MSRATWSQDGARTKQLTKGRRVTVAAGISRQCQDTGIWGGWGGGLCFPLDMKVHCSRLVHQECNSCVCVCGENLRVATSGVKSGHFRSSGLHEECGVTSKQAPHLAPKTTLEDLEPGVGGHWNPRHSAGPTAGL